ncbi:MAG: tetratricopeptide repeat protein [Thermodesulfobacteria bacterium]|nr:tetratricopeptide repeat protein [Thermodesulfobacteriota bacterium]
MDAVTYPDEKVTRFLQEKFIPVRLAHDHPELSRKFNVTWTPALFILDEEGTIHHSSVGFLSPEELIPFGLLGLAKVAFDQGRYDQALGYLDDILEHHPESAAVPETIYLRAVCLFKKTNDASALKKAYEELSSRFPENEWTKRAYPYQLLQP